MEMDEEKSREMKRAMQMQMQRRDARIDQEGAEVGEVEDVDGGWVVGVVVCIVCCRRCCGGKSWSRS
jgi:hypothetical protein